MAIDIFPCEGDDWKSIIAGLSEFNQQQVPEALVVPLEFPQFKVVIDGVLRGGILCRVEAYNVLWIEALYVHPDFRKHGIGSQLMERAHQYAREKSIRLVHLSTYDFQARGFYEKHGYTLYGELENFPPGHRKFFLKRELT